MPIRPPDLELNSPLDTDYKANELLQREALEPTMSKIGHSRLVGG